MAPFPQRLRCQEDGDFYLMDLAKDTFVHFTPPERAEQIIRSGKLLMRPPYKKFGIDAVTAVSAVWGSFVPGVQTTHSKRDDLVAVVFQTRTLPQVGHPEEVIWKRDVALVNPKIVSYSKGKGMLRSGFDGQVYYSMPSWCDGVESRTASLLCNPNALSGAWIDPTGKVYEIRRGLTHDQWADDHLTNDREYQQQMWDVGAGSLLQDRGWVRFVNFINMAVGTRPSRAAMEAAADLVADCVLSRRDVDPEKDTLWLETGPMPHARELSISTFIEEYGSKATEEKMWEGLLARLASRVTARYLDAACGPVPRIVVAANLKALKPNDWLTVYHGTTLSTAPKLLNGFDSTRVKSRQFGGPRHKGLFVTPTFRTARNFASYGPTVLEMVVRAKNLHGTDYSGVTGRDDPRREEIWRDKYPDSFRPYLSQTLTQGHEPQALLQGLVAPRQIKRVWHAPGQNEPGQWYSRKEFLDLGLDPSANPRDKQDPLRDLGIDLSYPNYDYDEFIEALGVAYGKPGKPMSRERIEKTLTMHAEISMIPGRSDTLLELIEGAGFQGRAAQRYADRFRETLAQQSREVAASASRVAARYLVADCNLRLPSHSWIDPKGKVHLVPLMHDVWAEEKIRSTPSMLRSFVKRYREYYPDELYEIDHPWTSFLVDQGWVRVANFLNFEGRDHLVSPHAWESAADLIINCVVKKQLDPETTVVTVAGYGKQRYSVSQIVREWGGRKAEDRLFGALMARTAARLWYHGTEKRFEEFKTFESHTFGSDPSEVPLFFSPSKSFAKMHAQGPKGVIYTARLKWRKVFDSANLYRESRYWPPERDALTQEGKALYDDLVGGKVFPGIDEDDLLDGYPSLWSQVLRMDYDVIETTEFKRWLKKNGYDAAYVTGDGEQNVFVFSPRQVEVVGVQRASASVSASRVAARHPVVDIDPSKVKFKIRSSSDAVAVEMRYGGKRIGGMNAHKVRYPEEKDCPRDVTALAERFPELVTGEWKRSDGEVWRYITALAVFKAFITEEEFRGYGLGKKMYKALMGAWFKKVGPFLFMPYKCDGGSGTSPDAMRVWHSLAKEFPSSGDVVAVMKNPRVARGQLPQYRKRAHTPDSSEEVENWVDDFGRENNYTPGTCDLNRGDCDMMSNVFADWFEDQTGVGLQIWAGQGFIPPLGKDANDLWVMLSGDKAHKKGEKPLSHVVVVWGDWVIDLTGRQFGSKYKAPVYSLSEFKKRWATVGKARRADRGINNLRRMMLQNSSDW